MDTIPDRYKLNCSGYEATILDFTLSRAKVPTPLGPHDSEVVFYNLDTDMELYNGEGLDQYQVYRE